MTTYLCQPSAPLQKGSAANSDGRVLRFLLSDADIARIPAAQREQLVARLSHTPRRSAAY